MNPEKVKFRQAILQDLNKIVNLLADDELGTVREDTSVPLNQAYFSAFDAIKKDPNNQLIVAVSADKIAGILQLTFIPNLSYKGRWRAHIEAVRIHKNFRSLGLGQQIIQHAVDLARKKNCHLVQLTSNKSREKAIDFYRKLGFVDSHEGFKYPL